MSNRCELPITATRAIHPRAIKQLGGEKYCIAALQVASWLRDGTIPPKRYSQLYFSAGSCGTIHCVGGWIVEITRDASFVLRANKLLMKPHGHKHLFCSFPFRHRAPTCAEAADAIERYIFDGDEQPWRERTDVVRSRA
jgi:hypothetical protein